MRRVERGVAASTKGEDARSVRRLYSKAKGRSLTVAVASSGLDGLFMNTLNLCHVSHSNLGWSNG